MNKKGPSICPTRLRELIYTKDDQFFWHKRPRELFKNDTVFRRWNKVYADTLAFKYVNEHGYARITIFGRTYLGHRVIWAWHKGQWPDGLIDHINGIRSDNRIENLRVVDPAENMRNVRIGRGNTSGVMGVSWDCRAGKWKAAIKVNRKSYSLGSYVDKNQAISARKEAERKFGFHSNHGCGAAFKGQIK